MALSYAIIMIIGCAYCVASQNQEQLVETPSCEVMDPAAMQLRICELQQQLEAMQDLMFYGLLSVKNEPVQESFDLKQKRKNEFIRFGKRKNEFIRFGKRKNEFIRFGRSDGGNPEASADQYVAKRKNEFIRFG